MHFGHPIAQTVQNEAAGDGVVGIKAVARAAVIRVVSSVFLQNVIGAVFETLEGEGGSFVVTLGRVVKHHIQNHFDARLVHCLHHIPKLVHRAKRGLVGAVRGVGREEADGTVTPIVDAQRRILRVKLLHREQLYRSNAQFAQVGNFLHQPRISSPFRWRDSRTGGNGEAAHMQFVDDGVGVAQLERHIPFPIVSAGVYDDAFHGHGAIIAGAHGHLAVVTAGHDRRQRIWVEQDFPAIEAETNGRVMRAIGAVGVNLPRLEAGHEHVPVVEGAVFVGVEAEDTSWVRVIGRVEEQKLNRFAILGEDAEIHSIGVNRCAKGVAGAGVHVIDVTGYSLLVTRYLVG